MEESLSVVVVSQALSLAGAIPARRARSGLVVPAGRGRRGLHCRRYLL